MGVLVCLKMGLDGVALGSGIWRLDIDGLVLGVLGKEEVDGLTMEWDENSPACMVRAVLGFANVTLRRVTGDCFTLLTLVTSVDDAGLIFAYFLGAFDLKTLKRVLVTGLDRIIS
jgi:hypothetical protein